MANNGTRARIVSDPGILGGKPVIAGTRISVQHILEKMGEGWTIDDLLDDYPQLTRELIAAAGSVGLARGSETAGAGGSRQRASAVGHYLPARGCRGLNVPGGRVGRDKSAGRQGEWRAIWSAT